MTEKEIVGAFEAYIEAFGPIPLTLIGMDDAQREAAGMACAAAVEKKKRLTSAEIEKLEPERVDGATVF